MATRWEGSSMSPTVEWWIVVESTASSAPARFLTLRHLPYGRCWWRIEPSLFTVQSEFLMPYSESHFQDGVSERGMQTISVLGTWHLGDLFVTVNLLPSSDLVALTLIHPRTFCLSFVPDGEFHFLFAFPELDIFCLNCSHLLPSLGLTFRFPNSLLLCPWHTQVTPALS